MKSAFVTGITGMVGSHLVDYLLKETDWNIYGFCRWNDSLENIEHLAEEINNNERLKLLYGDLNDLASILVALDESQPHYVFHLAAQTCGLFLPQLAIYRLKPSQSWPQAPHHSSMDQRNKRCQK